MNKTYCVYTHIFPNGKKYIGVTCQKPEHRWNNGRGYRNNKYLERAINKYCWHNVEHKILYTDLLKEEAELVTKINDGNICECCHNHRKTAGGYIWKYEAVI